MEHKLISLIRQILFPCLDKLKEINWNLLKYSYRSLDAILIMKISLEETVYIMLLIQVTPQQMLVSRWKNYYCNLEQRRIRGISMVELLYFMPLLNLMKNMIQVRWIHLRQCPRYWLRRVVKQMYLTNSKGILSIMLPLGEVSFLEDIW